MTFSKTEWALLVAIMCTLTCLVSCAGSRPPGIITPPISGVGSVVSNLSLYITALATVGFIGFIVTAFITGLWLKFGRYAIACLIAISASQFAYWYGKHVGAITWTLVGVAMLGLGYWLYLHRLYLERKLKVDLNRDGRIG